MVAAGDDRNIPGHVDVGADAVDVARLVSAAVPLPLRPPPMIGMHKMRSRMTSGERQRGQARIGASRETDSSVPQEGVAAYWHSFCTRSSACDRPASE
jgi:hypothetical protein